MKRSPSFGRRSAVLLVGFVLGCGSVSEAPDDGGGGAGGGGGGSAGGALGTAGTTGTGGALGAAGTTGTAGALGAAGTTGAGGTTGSAGTTGAAGATGTGGVIQSGGAGGGAGRGGTTGAAGTTGTGGGNAGRGGTTGVAGTTGAGGGNAGRGGTTGVAGTTGTGGGNAGRGGTTGAAGTTGVAGTTGAAGTGGTGGMPGVCTPGTAMCVGLTPQLCNAQGQWQSGTPCPFLCSGGFCTGACVPNTRRCSSTGLPQLCSAAGAWVDQSPCQFVCTGSGVCGGQCVPNSMRCQGGQNQTCDTNGFWQNTGTSMLQLLRNGSFDTTPVSWTAYGDPAIVALTDPSYILAHTPPNALLEAGYAMAQDDVFQAVTIPAGASSITLSFFAFVGTDDSYAYAYDLMDAYVSEVGGVAPAILVELTNLTVTTNWTRFTAAVPLTYAGRTVEFGFAAATNDLYDTLFLVDTATLNVTACASAGGTSGP